MEIVIAVPADKPRQEIISLKNFIEKASIEGLSAAEIDEHVHQPGHMGGGIINSITAVIVAAQKPLVKLIECLQKFVDNYRTEIIIPNKNGNDIVIKHGRSMKPEELQELTASILKSL